MKILVLNCGSSSVKYQVIETATKEKFIDDYLEEFIFCMHNDEEFKTKIKKGKQ